MSKIEDVVKNYNYESLVDDRKILESDLTIYEEELGISFGPQLKDYILNYGYLAYEYIEFDGINANQKLNSDMIRNTKSLRNLSDKIKELVVIENQGDGDYYLVDSNDNMFEFIQDNSLELKKLDIDLCQYIQERFSSMKNN